MLIRVRSSSRRVPHPRTAVHCGIAWDHHHIPCTDSRLGSDPAFYGLGTRKRRSCSIIGWTMYPYQVRSLLTGPTHCNLYLFILSYRSICEFYARGRTYEELHEANRRTASKWTDYIENTSFKFEVSAYNHSIPQRRQRDIVESFSYMALLGKIDMKNPQITFVCLEECR